MENNERIIINNTTANADSKIMTKVKNFRDWYLNYKADWLSYNLVDALTDEQLLEFLVDIAVDDIVDHV